MDTIDKMKFLQKELSQKIIQEDRFETPRLIGGLDVSNNLRDPSETIYAAAVILNYPQLEVIEQTSFHEKQTLPYIPGFLGFREVPTLIKAVQQLARKPDLLLVDGHGISHPRGLGVASHLGVLLDLPTIGVAKSILVGHPATALLPDVGSQAPLEWRGNIIGMLYRSKKRANPLIISTGHRISLPSAVEWVIKCLRGYRLPEPTRQAHLAANRERSGSSCYNELRT